MLPLLSAIVSSEAFSWPPSYTLRGTWKVPYTNLSNSLLVVHEPKRQYTSELNGLLRQWNTGPEERIHRKIITAYDREICYNYPTTGVWDIELTEFLPDPEGYAEQPGLYQYNGRLCRMYMKVLDTDKTQTWKMYVDRESGAPVAYVAQAISIYGSHYDVYVLEINEFQPYALPGVWDIPTLCDNATTDPYPGEQYNLFFPKKGVRPASAGANHTLRFAHMAKENWVRSIAPSLKQRKNLMKMSQYADKVEDVCEVWPPAGVEINKSALPESFSWRDYPEIVGKPRDQVACGSCWAFGTAELLESQFAIKYGKFREVSVNQILDCTWDAENFGCQGGEVGPALSSLMYKNMKIATEKEYPYLGLSGICAKSIEDPLGSIKRCYHIRSTTDAVKQALLKFGPLAISINVIEEMSLYTSGVFDNEQCTGTDSEMVHIVQLTGWRVIDGKEAWEVKNSWSTYWGDEGYIYIQSKNQEWNCGVTTRAVAVEVE